MEPIVKYQFDREMVAFVKTLEIKSSMFGYDKNDVYNKFKDLLVRARDVCEALVAEERASLLQLKEKIENVADDPVAIRLLLAEWSPVSAVVEAEELVEEVDLSLDESPEEASPKASEAVDGDELAKLRAELEEYAKRDEMLAQAHAIVTEARLERESIIRDAQMMAEQELFLYRAKRRDEEAAFEAQMNLMEAERNALESENARYRAYAKKAETLFSDFRAYVSELDEFEGRFIMPKQDLPKEIDPERFDPPVLSSDMGTACTEESMPLCEMAEAIPEDIYHEQDDAKVQPEHDNEPLLTEPEDLCDAEA